MSNPPVKMEVDNPVLKRSSSAPMINELSSAVTPSTQTATTSRYAYDLQATPCRAAQARGESSMTNLFAAASVAPRTRRFSASSFSPTGAGCAPAPAPRLTPRVNQLRREECLDVAVGRETAHERELNNTMVMSQSWEDLTIVGTSPKHSGGGDAGDRGEKGRVGVCDPLHLNLSSLPPLCSSPSPTRVLNARQVFSPTLNMFGRANLSPSPTRKFTTRRSLSPIAMRPSALCPAKRKFELDDRDVAEGGGGAPAAKRHSTGGLLMPHSRLDLSGSPLAGSLSSVGTPESVSSADSPGGFGYHPHPRMEDSPGANGGANVTDHPMRDLTKGEAEASGCPS